MTSFVSFCKMGLSSEIKAFEKFYRRHRVNTG